MTNVNYCLYNLKVRNIIKSYNLSPFTASTPAMISLCPAINLVAECMTISVGNMYQPQLYKFGHRKWKERNLLYAKLAQGLKGG